MASQSGRRARRSPVSASAARPVAAMGRPTAQASTRGLRVLCVASAVGGLAQSLAGAGGALLARQLSGSEVTAGLPQAGLVLGSAAAALVLSRITAARGRRTSLATGAVSAVLGCAAVITGAFTGSLPGVLVGCLLLGAGNTAVTLLRYAAADLVDELGRARAMASVLVATAAGAVVGPSLLGPTDELGTHLGLPALTGPYLLAAPGFAATAMVVLSGLTEATPAAQTSASASGVSRSAALTADARHGLVVLGLANLVMVAVMTMAPVQLHHLGHGLTSIGAVISVHLAAMFAPSPFTGWCTNRLGPRKAAAAAGVLLALACTVAAAGSTSLPALSAGMLLLGLGWNLALVSGSVLLTAGVHPAARPDREGGAK